MSALAAIQQARQLAATMMVDTGRVTRDGEPTFDPDTGLVTPSATTIYEGPVWMRMPTVLESEVLFGEEQVSRTRYLAVFPYDVTGVRAGDVITLTETEDPDAEGREFRVLSVPTRTYYDSKRFPCEVVQ